MKGRMGAMNFRHLMAKDIEIFNAVQQEIERQQSKIELIASENFVSEASYGSHGKSDD